MAVANAMSGVAWIPQADLSEEEWLATGRRLGSIGRGSKWWLGDWLRHGSSRFGDRFSEAARVTGYDRATLRSIAWIAARVDASVRRDRLTWDHHVAVASLEPAEQEHWLERAESEELEPDELRQQLRTRGEGDAGGPTAHVDADEARNGGGAVCPHCGHPQAAV